MPPHPIGHGVIGSNRMSCLMRQPLHGRIKLPRQKRCVVVAFKADSETLEVPLDFYKCLSVNRGASKDAVRKSCERLLHSAPDVGYSQDALFSRAVLLQNAADCLADLDSRKTYEAQRRQQGATVAVASSDFPGALSLLQECGDADAVIDLGCRWLAANPAAVDAADVAGALALAYCDKAGEALQQNSDAVAPACTHLHTALRLLQHHNLSAQLQQQITQTLEDYAPNYCLELLELPLAPAGDEQRAAALAQLHHLLWEPSSHPDIARNRDAFVAAARVLLTAEEQVMLYSDVPPGTRVSAQEMADTALACVAAGFASYKPQLVAQAAGLYAQVAGAATASGQLDVDVNVERAACLTLLGEPEQALALLGMGTEHGAATADEGVRTFILENSPNASDLLPGLVALTTSWLQEAVVPSFRPAVEGAPPAAVSLDHWFEAPWVNAYLQVSTTAKRFNVGALAHALLASLATFFAALRSAVLGAWQALTGARHRTRAADGPARSASIEAELSRGAGVPTAVAAEAVAAQELRANVEVHSAASRDPGGAPATRPAQRRYDEGTAPPRAVNAEGACLAAGEEEKEVPFDQVMQQQGMTVEQLKAFVAGGDDGADVGPGAPSARAERTPSALRGGRGGRGSPQSMSDDAAREREWRRQAWLKQQAQEEAAGDVEALDDPAVSPFTAPAFKEKRAEAQKNLQELEAQMWDSEPLASPPRAHPLVAPMKLAAGALLVLFAASAVRARAVPKAAGLAPDTVVMVLDAQDAAPAAPAPAASMNGAVEAAQAVGSEACEEDDSEAGEYEVATAEAGVWGGRRWWSRMGGAAKWVGQRAAAPFMNRV